MNTSIERRSQLRRCERCQFGSAQLRSLPASRPVVFVYPLGRTARQQLAATTTRPAWRRQRPKIMLDTAQSRSLRSFLQQVPDSRSCYGLRYPMETVLTMLIAARLAGCQTLTQLSDFGRALSQ